MFIDVEDGRVGLMWIIGKLVAALEVCLFILGIRLLCVDYSM